MNAWNMMWMAFIVLFLLAPVGYGWGYRGWGAPYPRHIQRRRANTQRESTSGRPSSDAVVSFDHHAWGWGGDFVWTVMVIGLVWAVIVWWR